MGVWQRSLGSEDCRNQLRLEQQHGKQRMARDLAHLFHSDFAPTRGLASRCRSARHQSHVICGLVAARTPRPGWRREEMVEKQVMVDVGQTSHSEIVQSEVERAALCG